MEDPVQARDQGLTYREALDEALCLGWIDGVRRRWDDASFSVRFSPRKPRSTWSALNIARARQLQGEGRLQAAGLAAFEARVEAPSPSERRGQALASAYLRRLRANPRTWRFLQAQPPWYRRTSASWVMQAKRPETRLRRLEVLIAYSQKEKPIPSLQRAAKRGGGAGRAKK